MGAVLACGLYLWNGLVIKFKAKEKRYHCYGEDEDALKFF